MNKESLRAPLENGLKRALAGKGGRAEPMFVMSGPPNGQKSGDPEAHNQNDDDQDGPSLTQSQELALPALLTCPTVKAAARQCGVHERTIRRWLHDDEHFQKTLRQFRNEALSQASTHLQQGATHAVGAMYELIGSDGLIETGRANLIRTALDFAFRSGAYGDLADRIADLEKVAPEEKKD